MSKPLPWFNNDVDPDDVNGISIPYKLPLYRFDTNQRHDLVVLGKITHLLYKPLVEQLDELPFFHGFNNSQAYSVTNLLFERFVPWNYEYAEYSKAIFDLWRRYTGTEYYTDRFVSGRLDYQPAGMAAGFGNEFSTQPFNFNQWKCNQILNLNLPSTYQNEQIVITWYAKAHDINVPVIPYGNNTAINNIDNQRIAQYWIKRYKVINVNSNNLLLSFNLNYIANCSMVVNCNNPGLKADIEQQINDISLGYLFSNFTAMAADIDNQINVQMPELLKVASKIEYTSILKEKTSAGEEQEPYGVVNNITKVDKPDWYYFASLIYANNNKYNNGIINQDLGKELTFKHINYTNIQGYYYNNNGQLANLSSLGIHGHYYEFWNLPDLIDGDQGTSHSGIGFYHVENQNFVYPKYNDKYFNRLEIGDDHVRAFFTGEFKYPRLYKGFTGGSVLNRYGLSLINGNSDSGKISYAQAPQNYIHDSGYPYTYSGALEYIFRDIDETYNRPIANNLLNVNNKTPKEQALIDIDEIIYKINTQNKFDWDTMPDSFRIVEIHEAVGANEHIADTAQGTNPENIYHNTVRIKRVLGISTDPKDRTLRPIRQRATIKHGDPIPAGWHYGQFGENTGEQYQKGTDPNSPALGVRDGIAIEGIPNKFVTDPFDRRKVKIIPGDTVLCENIPQAIAEIMDQLDAALGLQESAAFTLPNADGSGKIGKYEGLHALLAEIAFTTSKISENTSRTEIATLINQAIAKELLAAFGLPISPKVLPVKVAHGVSNIPYPALAPDSPSMALMVGWILKNLGILTAQELKK